MFINVLPLATFNLIGIRISLRFLWQTRSGQPVLGFPTQSMEHCWSWGQLHGLPFLHVFLANDPIDSPLSFDVHFTSWEFLLLFGFSKERTLALVKMFWQCSTGQDCIATARSNPSVLFSPPHVVCKWPGTCLHISTNIVSYVSTLQTLTQRYSPDRHLPGIGCPSFSGACRSLPPYAYGWGSSHWVWR